MTALPYWLGLTLIPGLGLARLRHLLAHFATPERLWHARDSDLRQAGIPEKVIATFVGGRAKIDLEQAWQKVEKTGAQVISQEDAAYPPLLKALEDAPLLLYVRGQLLPRDQIALAIVGTRRASRYGHDAAHHLAQELAAAGITIVSGLAQGIDTAAHMGAINAGGRTIAVLACGIDRLYPKENAPLAGRIVECGALVTEYPVGTPPTPGNFPRRNRLLSGLALGVLIAEAPERSGALITATAALEQGRDVFAVPANIFNPQGAGVNRLIQDGAKLVMTARDILDEFHPATPAVSPPAAARPAKNPRPQPAAAPPAGPPAPVPADLSAAEATLLAQMTIDPLHIDDLIRAAGLSAAEVSVALTLLELKGLAHNSGSMQYCRTR
ncbi:MAG: DNA-processing protein DprA [Anaerolineae bacterium]|nr:DNA-processing protein DprA [Anaerolineae bacterium]